MHLADTIELPKGSCTFKQFSDGEWSVKIHDTVKQKEVWVLAQTGAPADNLVQLLLLCDALKQEGASINLLITYFGYARQDRPFKGEPLAAELMCKLIQISMPKRIEVIHLHSPQICRQGILKRLPFFSKAIPVNHIPYEFFYGCIQNADVIVSPDKGAGPLAQHIAKQGNKELVMFEKYRPEPEKLILKMVGEVRGKRVLIVDDMITTGGTVITAAEQLFEQGATSVRVAATHGVFSGDALARLNESRIEQIQVTNTLVQTQSPEITVPKVRVIDISPFIRAIIDKG
jgi:ribose-phosphate pyrophosphokinase